MASEAIEFVVKLRGGPTAAADVRKVREEVGKLGGSVKKVGSESGKAAPGLRQAERGITGVGKALIAAGAGFVAWEAGKKAFEFTHELTISTKQLSSAFGLGTQEASRWAGVVAAVGGNSSQAGVAFQKVAAAAEKQTQATRKLIAQEKIHSATTLRGVEPLEKLGLSTAYLEKNQKNLGPVMEKVITNIHGISNAQVKGSVLTNLFGRGWKQLSPILLEGGNHLKHLMDLAKEFGVEIGSEKGIEDFRERTIESNLATEGLRLRFTELAAKPMADLLKGFSDLSLAIQTGQWDKFNAQAQKMGEVFSHTAEVVIPHVAETAGHLAPIVFKAFVKGFLHASFAGQALIGLLVIKKLGLTEQVFGGAGHFLAGKLAGGMAGESGAISLVGGKFGGLFGKAFIAAAIGAGIYSFLKNSDTEEPLSEAFHDIFGGHTALENKNAESQKAERQHYLHHRAGQEAKFQKGRDPYRNLNATPKLRSEVEAYDHKHHTLLGKPIPKAAMGGHVSMPGLVEVGERGPETLMLPAGAQVDPLPPGSLRDERPIVLKVDGRTFGIINRRNTLESMAAGA